LLTNISHFLNVNRLIILFQKGQCRHKKALSGLEKVLIKNCLQKMYRNSTFVPSLEGRQK